MKTLKRISICFALAATLALAADAQLFGKKKDDGKKKVVDVTSKATTDSTSSKKEIAGDDYVIGVEDVLTVNVWRENEMSKDVPVRPDGKISLPLLGEFVAAGKTPMALQAELKKKLETVVTNPEVTVIVRDIRSQKFSILGEVMKPGSYPLMGKMSVLDAIAQAGGFKDFANPKKMYILRRASNGDSQRIPFNYNDMLKGKQQVIELESRDTIVVP
jgi:polysaccharide export outer membrane protein